MEEGQSTYSKVQRPMRTRLRAWSIRIGAVLMGVGSFSLLSAAASGLLGAPYIIGALWFVLPGLLLVLWGVHSPRVPSVDDGSRSTFWTAVSITVGALFTLYGLFVGLVLAFLFGATRGLLAFLSPWGVIGLALIGYGVGRALTYARRPWAIRESRSVLASIRTGVAAAPASGVPPTPDITDLQAIHGEIVRSVEAVYRVTSPAIRAAMYLWWLSWIVGTVYIAAAVVSPFGVILPLLGFPSGAIPLFADLALIPLLGLGLLEVGVGVPARLAELNRSASDLRAGKIPEVWHLVWWIPYVYTARLIYRAVARSSRTSPTNPESSVLESSYAILRFGRWLSYYARYWYTSIFIFLVVGGLAALLLGTLIGIDLTHAGGGAFVGLAALLVVLVGAFWYLYKRYSVLDSLSDRLAMLGAAEEELARAFWSRF